MRVILGVVLFPPLQIKLVVKMMASFKYYMHANDVRKSGTKCASVNKNLYV